MLLIISIKFICFIKLVKSVFEQEEYLNFKIII